jgi:hypothetical protein
MRSVYKLWISVFWIIIRVNIDKKIILKDIDGE